MCNSDYSPNMEIDGDVTARLINTIVKDIHPLVQNIHRSEHVVAERRWKSHSQLHNMLTF